MPRAVALFNGTLDAALAVRLMQSQGIEVEAVWVRTPCNLRELRVRAAAERLQFPLTILPPADDLAELVILPTRASRHATPCRDCRVSLFRVARRYAEQTSADFGISGEVLGQDPHLQRRRDLEMIAIASGWEDRLLRPLSALRMPETRAERAGLVDRQKLLDFQGESRKPQLELARQWQLDGESWPSATCALLDGTLAAHIDRIARSGRAMDCWTIEVLRCGRIEWLANNIAVVISRREEEGMALRTLFARNDARQATMIEPVTTPGPVAIALVSNLNASIRDQACNLIRQRMRGELDNIEWLIQSRER